ncbi:hypothetical protein A3B51_02410 [Candidatus Curtissbacteria bacterium RIFCSPLOWO2_01_FULL_41_18]|uniref:HTH marR-type domain-containing protein n=1 Tax=Candidatus Curtissbacteria bacterium RIFCSPLOWO2_01_FULL_41_18 TaxID=1797727 RepID=A0A1F5HL72_9BACT|nr:MAG: hypothetical protein A3B51_02410 [Candidatus Curtissbacteria bacterium RIFCSPLOWO2_01_FULL_41_18]
MEHTLIFHSIDVAKRIQKVIDFKSPPLSLSYSQASALLVSDSQKEITQKELASKLRLEPATIVTLIDELERLKLVKRVSIDDDRRKYHIALTPAGKNKAKQIKVKTVQLDSFLKNKLAKQELNNLHSILTKLTVALGEWKGGEK